MLAGLLSLLLELQLLLAWLMLLLPELLFPLLVEVLSLLIALQLLLVCRLVLLFLLGLLLCWWNCYLAGDESWQGRGVLFLPPGLPLYSQPYVGYYFPAKVRVEDQCRKNRRACHLSVSLKLVWTRRLW
jgi:hypothetical protein